MFKKIMPLLFCAFTLSGAAQLYCREFTENELSKMFDRHCAKLKNLDVAQKPLMITFSGTPGMGKSYVAKKLEDAYLGVRISTDDLRTLFDEIGVTTIQERDAILQQYLVYFFGHFKMPNRRFIFDASIDRKYKQLFPFCKQNNMPCIVIRLDVSRDMVMQRIQDRGEKVSWHLKHIDAFFEDYYNFAKSCDDYILFANVDGADFSQLLEKLDKKIASCST
jgi:predicted kinase